MVVRPFIFYLLTIVLAILLWFTASDYLFGIFKLSVHHTFVSLPYCIVFFFLRPLFTALIILDYFMIILLYIVLFTSLLLLFWIISWLYYYTLLYLYHYYYYFHLLSILSKNIIVVEDPYQGGGGRVSINYLNPATCLCISKAITWIPNAMPGGVFLWKFF